MGIVTTTFSCTQAVVKECPDSSFFMSIIIMAASLVERVLLIRILNVVMSTVDVSTLLE
jgi:hypothetical protein